MSGPVDRRLLRTVPALRRHLAGLAALQAATAGLAVAQAMLLADTVVRIASGDVPARILAGRLTALLAVMCGRAAVAGGQEWLSARASLRVRAALRRATLDAAVHLGPGWAQRQAPGRLAGAIGPGLDHLDGFVTRALPALVAACVTPPVVLAAIGWTDWSSGLILLVLLPLVPLFMVLIGVTTRRLVERQYATLERVSGHFLDLVRGLPTLRIYGRAHAQEQTLRGATDRLRRHTLAALRVALLSGLVLDLVAALSIAVVAVDVGLRLDAGHTSFLTALTVLLLAPELYAPLRAVGAQHHAAQEGAAAARAALDIVDEAGRAPSPTGTGGPLTVTGGIEVDDLEVTYPGRPDPALSVPHLAVVPGQVVALTGPSGAGKSTLLAALLGVVPVAGGAVRFTTTDGDIALADTDPAALRANLAWLPQRPAGTSATVADEVRVGDPTATDAQIAQICAICHTPHPATPLGEDGAAVSAGQRRRIALARSLLRAEAVQARGGTPVVLLDEPSEELDDRTERVVAAVIDGLRGWATVLIATHSEALVRLADLHVVLHAGRPVRCERQRPIPAPAPAAAAGAFVPRVAPRVVEPAAGVRGTVRLVTAAREAGAGRRLLLAGGLAAASALAGLGLTACSMWLIGRAAQHPNVQALAVAVVGVRAFAVGRAVLRYAERLAAHDGALRMLVAVRARVFAALAPVPLATLARYGRGDLLRRFVGDVDGAQEALVRGAVPAVGALAAAGGAVTITALLSPAAGLALAGGLAVAALAVPAAARLAAGPAATLTDLAGRRDRVAVTVAGALPELVAYGAAERSIDAVSDLDTTLARAARRPAAAAAAGVTAAGLAAAATLLAVLAAAATAVTGGLPAPDVAVLVACVLVAFEAAGTLPAAAVAWARCRAGLHRVAELLAVPPAVPEPAHPLPAPAGGVGLRARGLAVAPAADVPAVLDGVTLDVPPGGSVAVAGPSGCGKSTLLATVLRQARVRAGRLGLTTGGRPTELAALAADDLPPLVAGSLQGDHVFDATLRDNLRVVRPEASEADLDRVAERVGLQAFVHTLPLGWDTPAGPDGCALSGGQRQRLLLGRALLADPEILVLDEPTAHLDADTEREVLDGLLDPRADRTVVFTSHRAAALDHAGTALRVEGRALRPVRADRRQQHG